MTRKIFISYRRADNRDVVQRICDWFVLRYGHENVLMDFHTSPYFGKYAEFVRERVRESDIVVAIIGPQWLNFLRDKEASGDEDVVRAELAVAIEEGKFIAPILIRSAQMPLRAELPADLRPLADYIAAPLDSDGNFFDNMQQIVDRIERDLARCTAPPITAPKPPQPAPPQMTAEDFFNRGVKRQKNQEYDAAIADYTEAIRLKPDYAEAYNNRGRARSSKTYYDTALEDYNAAIRLKPDYAEAYGNRGELYKAVGDLSGAIADCKRSVQLDPESPKPYHILGDCYYERKKDAEALQAYERYLEFAGKYPSRTAVDRVAELRKPGWRRLFGL